MLLLKIPKKKLLINNPVINLAEKYEKRFGLGRRRSPL